MWLEGMKSMHKSVRDISEDKDTIAMLDTITAMSDKELQQAAAKADLSDAELASASYWRDVSQFLAKYERQGEVRGLFFSIKNPTLSKIMAKLNIPVTNPYDERRLSEMEADGRNLFGLQGAIHKLQGKGPIIYRRGRRRNDSDEHLPRIHGDSVLGEEEEF